MGKNRVRESLIRKIVNVVVHKIILEHTNKLESAHFLEPEIIGYRSIAEKTSEEYSWDNEDKEYIKKKALNMIKEKLNTKYQDIEYSEQEAIEKLKEMLKETLG